MFGGIAAAARDISLYAFGTQNMTSHVSTADMCKVNVAMDRRWWPKKCCWGRGEKEAGKHFTEDVTAGSTPDLPKPFEQMIRKERNAQNLKTLLGTLPWCMIPQKPLSMTLYYGYTSKNFIKETVAS